MIKNCELDRLRVKEWSAFQAKKSAWDRFAEAKRLTHEAYVAMLSAWDERCRAKDEMNLAFEAMQTALDLYHVGKIPNRCSQSNRSTSVRDALQSFQRAQVLFKQAKAEHKAATVNFKMKNAERSRLENDYKVAEAEHSSLKEKLFDTIATVQEKDQRSRSEIVTKIDMEMVKTRPFYLGTIFGKDADIVPRDDGSGKIDIYFSGLAKTHDKHGDGHGHAVIDAEGNVVYLRDAWRQHDEFLIDDKAQEK